MFSGLPGTGKSPLAQAAGRQLRFPVFAVDWLLGAYAAKTHQIAGYLTDGGRSLVGARGRPAPPAPGR
jgi:adenylate kinase family enzyme